MDRGIAGIFLGAGGAFLFVYLVARFGDSAKKYIKALKSIWKYIKALKSIWKYIKALKGIWKYARITAIGRVPIRYSQIFMVPNEDGKGWTQKHAQTMKVRKGTKLSRTPQICFKQPDIFASRTELAIELPSIYKLHFVAPLMDIKWAGKIRKDRCCYLAEVPPIPPMGPRVPQYRKREGELLPVRFFVVNRRDGKGGWDGVREVLKNFRNVPELIRKRAEAIATPPQQNQ